MYQISLSPTLRRTDEREDMLKIQGIGRLQRKASALCLTVIMWRATYRQDQLQCCRRIRSVSFNQKRIREQWTYYNKTPIYVVATALSPPLTCLKRPSAFAYCQVKYPQDRSHQSPVGHCPSQQHLVATSGFSSSSYRKKGKTHIRPNVFIIILLFLIIVNHPHLFRSLVSQYLQLCRVYSIDILLFNRYINSDFVFVVVWGLDGTKIVRNFVGSFSTPRLMAGSANDTEQKRIAELNIPHRARCKTHIRCGTVSKGILEEKQVYEHVLEYINVRRGE